MLIGVIRILVHLNGDYLNTFANKFCAEFITIFIEPTHEGFWVDGHVADALVFLPERDDFLVSEKVGELAWPVVVPEKL